MLSAWLLALLLFAFSSLAIIKRYTEIPLLLDRNLPDPTNRNYRKGDLVVLAAFAMYVSWPAVMRPTHDGGCSGSCTLRLCLLMRALMVSHRREMDDDPVVWTMRDCNCRLGIVVSGIIAAAAL